MLKICATMKVHIFSYSQSSIYQEEKMEKISKPISIYALGGLGEVGKNMYCFEDESQIAIIDCGVKFPGVELPGIDYIVPDFTHLKNNKNKRIIKV